MKKKITLSLLLALCLVLSLGGVALASSEMAVPYMTDAAGLLTQDEVLALDNPMTIHNLSVKASLLHIVYKMKQDLPILFYNADSTDAETLLEQSIASTNQKEAVPLETTFQ